MQSIKDALDPHGLLNPGVLFSAAAWWEEWGELEAPPASVMARRERLSSGPRGKG